MGSDPEASVAAGGGPPVSGGTSDFSGKGALVPRRGGLLTVVRLCVGGDAAEPERAGGDRKASALGKCAEMCFKHARQKPWADQELPPVPLARYLLYPQQLP